MSREPGGGGGKVVYPVRWTHGLFEKFSDSIASQRALID